MRSRRTKPTGSFRVYHPASQRVVGHADALRDARTDAVFWGKTLPGLLEIQERFPPGEWAVLETVGGRGLRSHATMRGGSQALETSPKRLRHGDYIAVFEGIQNAGTPHASAKWKITRHGKEVGTMHESSAYGWGRPTTTMRQLVWSGVVPPGASDSRTSEYGLTFDQGPSDSHAQALGAFARAADRLISWRQKHEYPAIGFTHSGKAKRSTVRSGNRVAGVPGTKRRGAQQ